MATRGRKLTVASRQAGLDKERFTSFSRDELETIRRMLVSQNVTDAEFRIFIAFCQRMRLNPVLNQVYMIKRRQGYSERATIQLGIDGYRLVAARTGQHAGTDAPQFFYDANNQLTGCSVTVYRLIDDKTCAFTGYTEVNEYFYELSPLRRRMPKTMAAKCAEAQALRKGFPAELGGTYTTDEIPIEQDAVPLAPAETVADQEDEAAIKERQQKVEASKHFKDLCKAFLKIDCNSISDFEHVRAKYLASAPVPLSTPYSELSSQDINTLAKLVEEKYGYDETEFNEFDDLPAEEGGDSTEE